MPKLKVVTFGCQANELDSARIAGLLAEEGYVLTDDEREADLIILNGCSIREKAEQKLYSQLGTLRALKVGREGLRLGVAGCLGQREGEGLLRRFPHLDLVVGNGEHLAEIPSLARASVRHPVAATAQPSGFFPSRVRVHRDSPIRAWVAVMEGCDNYCSFCIVPFTRGRERSRPPEDILGEVADLAASGYRELTLLGQAVNSYGTKLAPPVPFAELLRRIDAVVGSAVRIRFTTSHPKDVTPELARAMAELPSVCEHIHLPVQAGASRTLQRMQRGYDREAYLEKVTFLRATVPHLSITTDLIAGFPGETDADFLETLSLMEAVDFDGCFAFKFNVRPGTTAANLQDHLSEEVKSDRLRRILLLQDRLSLRRNQALVGTQLEVLVDSHLQKRDTVRGAGRTRQNRIVHFEGVASDGALVNVEITAATAHHLKGVLIASS
jgi:tRNA-2-methylthio-N6-dimethylallyladenosine synthase